MTLYRRRWISAAAAATAIGIWRPTGAQSGIEYRQRGNRAEGVRGLPVSGYLIELVSFRVRHDEPPRRQPPARYGLRFYLDRDGPAHVVVREQENRFSYWLDKVTPSQPWRAGFGNVFEWPTREVLAQLPELRLEELGVTVRTASGSASSIERVAPAILYHTAAPQRVQAYEAAFVFNTSVEFEARLELADGTAVGAVDPIRMSSWPPVVPLRLRCDVGAVDAGRCRLRLRVRTRDTLERFDQVVEFFHQPQVV